MAENITSVKGQLYYEKHQRKHQRKHRIIRGDC